MDNSAAIAAYESRQENGLLPDWVYEIVEPLLATVEENEKEILRLKARLANEPWCQQCGAMVRECPACHYILSNYPGVDIK